MNITTKNLIGSIRYAIIQYRHIHNKEPNCIMLNQCAYTILAMEHNLLTFYTERITTIYGMPIRITREATDEINSPRFWLCEEGTIYNYDMENKDGLVLD